MEVQPQHPGWEAIWYGDKLPCNCQLHWQAFGWWCPFCENTGFVECTCFHRYDKDGLRFKLLTRHCDSATYHPELPAGNDINQSVWLENIYIPEANRRQGRAGWLCRRIQAHFPNQDIGGVIVAYGGYDSVSKTYCSKEDFYTLVTVWKGLGFHIGDTRMEPAKFSDGTEVTCFKAQIHLPSGDDIKAT